MKHLNNKQRNQMHHIKLLEHYDEDMIKQTEELSGNISALEMFSKFPYSKYKDILAFVDGLPIDIIDTLLFTFPLEDLCCFEFYLLKCTDKWDFQMYCILKSVIQSKIEMTIFMSNVQQATKDITENMNSKAAKFIALRHIRTIIVKHLQENQEKQM